MLLSRARGSHWDSNKLSMLHFAFGTKNEIHADFRGLLATALIYKEINGDRNIAVALATSYLPLSPERTRSGSITCIGVRFNSVTMNNTVFFSVPELCQWLESSTDILGRPTEV